MTNAAIGLNNYATGENSRFPELWRGCVGAWAMCLGPTGTRLHDFSGRQNWGTLTNMDAATDWVVSGGRYALDFDGVDDYTLAANKLNDLGSDYSIAGWFYVRSLPTSGNFACLLSSYDVVSGAVYGFDLRLRNDSGTQKLGFVMGDGTAFAGGSDVAYTLATASWVHILTRKLSSSLVTFINGVSAVTHSNALSIIMAAKPLYIAAFGSYTPSGGALLGRYADSQVDDIRIYNRALSEPEIKLLASRRGIAYERRSRRRVNEQAAAAALNAIYATRQTQLIGGGLL